MIEILQWSLNLVIIGSLIWLWLERKKSIQDNSDTKLNEAIGQLEIRVINWQTEFQKYEEIFQEKLKAMEVICEQANRTLKSSRATLGSFPLTQEESELKEAMNQIIEKDQIPSIAHLENTKLRIQKETSIDLKTLLRGQLA